MYLTYDEFIALGGEGEKNAFALAEHKASQQVDKLTQGRMKNLRPLPLCLTYAMLEAVNAYLRLSKQENNGNKMAYFSNGGISASYVLETETSNKLTVEHAIISHLQGLKDENGIPLLYAGSNI